MAKLEWTVEEEVHLFNALTGLRPVGLNKHFYMACIAESLSKSLKRNIDPKAIWEHMRTMYNLDALNEAEPLPFSNEEREFSLPESEFGVLMAKRRTESEAKRSEESNTSNSTNAPASIIAVATDYTKAVATPPTKERKDSGKSVEAPKRTHKRTRGSTSIESSSPSTTPPPTTSNKRRRN